MKNIFKYWIPFFILWQISVLIAKDEKIKSSIKEIINKLYDMNKEFIWNIKSTDVSLQLEKLQNQIKDLSEKVQNLANQAKEKIESQLKKNV